MTKRRSSGVRIMQILRSRIIRGVYEGRLPSIRALAKEMRSHPTTVQVALSKLEGLGLVHKAKRRGTFVVSGERSASEEAGLFARLILPPPIVGGAGEGSLWASNLIYGFHNASRRRGVNTLLHYFSSADEAVANVLAEPESRKCVGTVFLIMRLEARHLVRLAGLNSPVVAADCPPEDPVIPYVSFDNFGAGQLVGRHLVALGHRRIASLEYEGTGHARVERLTGLEQYLKGCGLKLQRFVCEGRLGLFLNEVVKKFDSYTALVNLMGRTPGAIVMTKLWEAGKHIPEDLSLIGIEGNQYAGGLGSSTCAVLQDRQMGETALEMLLDEQLASKPRCTFVPVKLADAKTTGPPRANASV